MALELLVASIIAIGIVVGAIIMANGFGFFVTCDEERGGLLVLVGLVVVVGFSYVGLSHWFGDVVDFLRGFSII